MNLRILKKLSKRAAPLLPLLGDTRKAFPAEKGDSYTGLLIKCRKHYERMRSVNGELYRECEIKTPARDGKGWVRMWPPSNPRKGTTMVGCVSGYYEPEWDEETAWEALRTLVYWETVDFGEDGEGPITPTVPLRTPTQVFAAADRLIAERQAEEKARNG